MQSGPKEMEFQMKNSHKFRPFEIQSLLGPIVFSTH